VRIRLSLQRGEPPGCEAFICLKPGIRGGCFIGPKSFGSTRWTSPDRVSLNFFLRDLRFFLVRTGKDNQIIGNLPGEAFETAKRISVRAVKYRQCVTQLWQKEIPNKKIMNIKKTNLALVEEAYNADTNGPEIVQSRGDGSRMRERGTFGKVDYWFLKKKARFDREPIPELTQQVLSTATTPMVLRPLGSLEEFLWLIDRNRPVHFALAAQVQGLTTVERWRDALNLVQLRHPLLSVSIEALSSAAALAYWQNNPALKEESIRICSPTDTRKLFGLGEDCAVLISARVVAIEPQASTAFWDIARHAMPGLAGAQTLKAISASRRALHRIVKNGIDVPTAAAVCAHAFAHEIRLSNLGNLPYGTEFGELKLQALWGPAVSARFEGALNLGVATANGALCLLETRVGSFASLLETAEQILLSACAA
jgi:hypothetical protein